MPSSIIPSFCLFVFVFTCLFVNLFHPSHLSISNPPTHPNSSHPTHPAIYTFILLLSNVCPLGLPPPVSCLFCFPVFSFLCAYLVSATVLFVDLSVCPSITHPHITYFSLPYLVTLYILLITL